MSVTDLHRLIYAPAVPKRGFLRKIFDQRLNFFCGRGLKYAYFGGLTGVPFRACPGL
jgi:hypothetical protein